MKLQICDRCGKNVYLMYSEGKKQMCVYCANKLYDNESFINYKKRLTEIAKEITKLENEYRDTEIKIEKFIDDFSG